MYDLILGLSSLVLIYGTIAIIAITIRAALRAKKKRPPGGEHALPPRARHKDEQIDEPYYQPICHHSRLLHLVK